MTKEELRRNGMNYAYDKAQFDRAYRKREKMQPNSKDYQEITEELKKLNCKSFYWYFLSLPENLTDPIKEAENRQYVEDKYAKYLWNYYHERPVSYTDEEYVNLLNELRGM